MRALLCLGSLGLLSACASIVSDNKSTTYLQTEPVEKARCELHGQDFTRVVFTPTSINLPSDAAPITVACKASGYRNTVHELDTKLDGWIFGNIIFGGIIGGVIDVARGAGQKYPPQITILLDPESFTNTAARDSHYDVRKQEVLTKWKNIMSEIQSQCSSSKNAGPPTDCSGKIEEAEQRKQKELDEIEARRKGSKLK